MHTSFSHLPPSQGQNFRHVVSSIVDAVEEIDLFQTLRNAYTDARYCENFKLPIEKAEILRQHVNELPEIAVKLYHEKVEMIAGQPLEVSLIQHHPCRYERTT
jgi:hypothetical protein